MLFVTANATTSSMFKTQSSDQQTKTPKTQSKQTKTGKITIVEEDFPMESHLNMLDMTARSPIPKSNQTTIDGILVVKKVRPVQTPLPHPLPTLSAHTCERCMLRPQSSENQSNRNHNSSLSDTDTDTKQTTLESLLIRLILTIIGLEPVQNTANTAQNKDNVEIEIDGNGRIRGTMRTPAYLVERAM